MKILIDIHEEGGEFNSGRLYLSFKEAIEFLEEQKEKYEEGQAAKADIDSKEED